MTPEHPRGNLPVTLAPHTDELLTSWISRHAEFYAVPPLAMLRHCLPEASSLHAANRSLNGDQVIRLAAIFSTEPATVRRMTLSSITQSSRRLLAARPLQSCSACCRMGHTMSVTCSQRTSVNRRAPTSRRATPSRTPPKWSPTTMAASCPRTRPRLQPRSCTKSGRPPLSDAFDVRGGKDPLSPRQ
ncbi:hypothetical protein KGO5_02371 [Sinorhizobium sp. KGO-5]|nr:hypothetical protein KGO5_02371 [Sinorhizobium sp. KGO-5]